MCHVHGAPPPDRCRDATGAAPVPDHGGRTGARDAGLGGFGHVLGEAREDVAAVARPAPAAAGWLAGGPPGIVVPQRFHRRPEVRRAELDADRNNADQNSREA
ncbi:hypothetical protein FHS29_000536 [Saccharothrix tamanrassetensis]|uniref:Uncharacterized protein n=1 Tax=Saccharothrix tamanrassetensis TaxID=1051531 RepID=A0A841CDY3_9PSEU|nr:hypothetical protein [Saccharothrix tamanrassetensis]MBB5953966.1 hypothetical protein [Saccharothrix tamanrassetensis]